MAGVLVTKEGAIVENAEVELYHYTGSDSPTEAKDTVITNALGEFAFSGLSNGIYHINAQYKDSLYGSIRNIYLSETDTIVDSL
ncbi:MAG: carboxypeptidase regulatory-like domain-containing protein, partial [Candidatus Brocadiaceae bacterium]|nr:carboxypeptidase regulatory-like domain-containing protein [Candidatus Brocadiaceae bacterium]